MVMATASPGPATASWVFWALTVAEVSIHEDVAVTTSQTYRVHFSEGA